MKKRLISIFSVIAMIVSFATVNVSADSFELNDGYVLENWSVAKYGDFMKPTITRSRVLLDTDEKHSGEAALKIHGASGHSHSGYIKTYVGRLDPAKKYIVGLWVKSPAKSTGKIFLQNAGDYKYLDGKNLWTAGYEEWTYLETEEISPSANGAIDLRFNISDINGGYMWIDDMSLVEVGGDDENLMPDGGFENVIQGIRDIKVRYTGSGKNLWENDSATISWKNPANSHISNVYVVDGDGNKVAEELSTVLNGELTCEITGINVSKATEYKIVAELAHNDSMVTDSKLEATVAVDPLEGLDAEVVPESAIEAFDIPDEIYDLDELFGARVVVSENKAAVLVSNPGTGYTLSELSVVDEKGMTVAEVKGAGLAAGAFNVITLDNIEDGTVYNYFLKMVLNGELQYHSIGFMGEEAMYECDADIYPLHVLKNGQPLTTLSKGDVNATRIVDNRNNSKAVDVLLSAALYYDDELILINETAKTIKPGEYAEIPATITLPEINDSKYELVIYFWDSADEQNVLRRKIKFN